MDTFPQIPGSENLAPAGRADLAYVRPIVRDGRAGYAIFRASGELVAVAETRQAAFAITRQHELDPVDVH